jgi:hypothetical protein
MMGLMRQKPPLARRTGAFFISVSKCLEDLETKFGNFNFQFTLP